jgi:hypothetical protein
MVIDEDFRECIVKVSCFRAGSPGIKVPGGPRRRSTFIHVAFFINFRKEERSRWLPYCNIKGKGMG